MSRENVERLRVAHEAFLAGKSEFGGELLDPEIEWDASESPVLDNSGIYRGIEDVAVLARVARRVGNRPIRIRTD